MFTGLIEKIGRISACKISGGGVVLSISHDPWETPLSPGESVSVNGCCLTVTRCAGNEFTCDVLEETVGRTNLQSRGIGAVVNLERALRADGRLGGHIVAGHVDGIGGLVAITHKERDHILRISCEKELIAGIVEKGSVACDGVSLTVSAVHESWFEANVIPFTWDHTCLSSLSIGAALNIETDIIGKYAKHHVEVFHPAKSGISFDDLERAGFV